ncbi:MAG: hypothetical protein IPN42_11870 [Methylococcaceae bacterium]|nr:hypothetical protein [Methylococcaceae bacterium]
MTIYSKLFVLLITTYALTACSYESNSGRYYNAASGFFAPDPSYDEVQKGFYCAEKQKRNDHCYDSICSGNLR